MAALNILILCLFLTGCSSLEHRAWQPGQKPGLTFENKSSCEKFTISNKIKYQRCF